MLLGLFAGAGVVRYALKGSLDPCQSAKKAQRTTSAVHRSAACVSRVICNQAVNQADRS